MTDSKEETINDPFDFFEKLKELNTSGTDLDEMPEGFGEFGLEATNPIPVCTVFGNIVYLSKLRTLNGDKVTYERRGSTGAANIRAMIDIYTISYLDKEITTLYLCPYNKKNSNRTPKGFKF